MGMYNEFLGQINCPGCRRSFEAVFQADIGALELHCFKLGDQIFGIPRESKNSCVEPAAGLENTDFWAYGLGDCPHCSQDLYVRIMVRNNRFAQLELLEEEPPHIWSDLYAWFWWGYLRSADSIDYKPIDPAAVKALLYQIKRRNGIPERMERLRQFREISCQRLIDFMPKEARQWLNVSIGYRLGKATSEELESASAACWKYLGCDASQFPDVHVAAVRAMLCLLYPDDCEDYNSSEPGNVDHSRLGLFEALECFVNDCNSVLDMTGAQLDLLKGLFPELSAPE